jgi:glutathionyl-hydroquinone reductase
MNAERAVALPPWFAPQSWVSVTEAAKYFKRTDRTIRNWCQDGTLEAFSCRVYRDARGRYWIWVPEISESRC